MLSALYGHYDLFTPKMFNKLKFSTILAKIMHAKPSDGDVEVWDTRAKAANQWLRAQSTRQNTEELSLTARNKDPSQLNHENKSARL